MFGAMGSQHYLHHQHWPCLAPIYRSAFRHLFLPKSRTAMYGSATRHYAAPLTTTPPMSSMTPAMLRAASPMYRQASQSSSNSSLHPDAAYEPPCTDGSLSGWPEGWPIWGDGLPRCWKPSKTSCIRRASSRSACAHLSVSAASLILSSSSATRCRSASSRIARR